ncbi:MAG: acetoin utilization protein AcuB [Candidatus Azotimanducaceae bacterium]|jgi:acetoin utilization protein AcuB
MDVQNIMTTTLTTVTPGQVVGDLFQLFKEVSYHHVPVVEDNKLVGIVSDRDISRNLSRFFIPNGKGENRVKDKDLWARPVDEIMSTALITIEKDTSIDFASILLLENNISCLLVVDGELMLEGLLTWKDILQYHVYSGDAD